ncbi:excalibur calcium-binding domain-containing protein [Nocardia huaxiensis]|uniref:Excalibur calcium-binding domain-containing protein n=1 Tax=Nocardia huaxiensis TaxID=2755382 RepID=A0A7D6VCX4_9NOCA|nr:excalibur calcium-binding domain-containing protein [Nocardia huaxiensis]QLY32013.1 excalibur calcium-binding domain-containing protein [Nocardia huaxiensis]UFS95587.1 excalibur calcium-binding domain-containing protein [Nocardia huaxiensis]
MKIRTSRRVAGSGAAGLAGVAIVAVLAAGPQSAYAEPGDHVPVPVTTKSESPRPYYANCVEVRQQLDRPLLRGQPGYRASLDPDGNGIAC